MTTSRIDYAESLERIVAWGCHRLASGRWRDSGSERLFALQWLRWSFLLEIAGEPGGKLRNYSWGRIDDPELPRIVLCELVKKKLVRSASGRLYAADGVVGEFVEELWVWLDQRTPDGFPPGY
jgi:hypothetical protein